MPGQKKFHEKCPSESVCEPKQAQKLLDRFGTDAQKTGI